MEELSRSSHRTSWQPTKSTQDTVFTPSLAAVTACIGASSILRVWPRSSPPNLELPQLFLHSVTLTTSPQQQQKKSDSSNDCPNGSKGFWSFYSHHLGFRGDRNPVYTQASSQTTSNHFIWKSQFARISCIAIFFINIQLIV